MEEVSVVESFTEAVQQGIQVISYGVLAVVVCIVIYQSWESRKIYSDVKNRGLDKTPEYPLMGPASEDNDEIRSREYTDRRKSCKKRVCIIGVSVVVAAFVLLFLQILSKLI